MEYRQIEFYGLPASGKSTLINMLSEKLNKAGVVKVYTKYKISRRELYKEWLSQRGIMYSLGAFFIWRGKRKKEKEDFKFWKGMCGKFAALKAMLLRCTEQEVVLIDHGRVQGLSSLLNRASCREKDLAWFLEQMEKNFQGYVLYIWLYIDEKDCYERMKNRGKHVRLMEYEEKAALACMRDMNEMYENIYCYMKKRGCGLKVDSTKSAAQCVDEIMEELRNKGIVTC